MVTATVLPRCPIRIDGEIFTSAKGSPALGENTGTILQEFKA
ncbi:hypothetical protein QE417_001182 [Mucilaginibacter terrae]|uniref:Uncharacterized protein n=1 Tax=Mucilaginibacter terrae TaxID=1955052 RepID=A0ABU3GTZ2_9SPHI|nr:hypothetical protein [Mucilaginibacter terrae]